MRLPKFLSGNLKKTSQWKKSILHRSTELENVVDFIQNLRITQSYWEIIFLECLGIIHLFTYFQITHQGVLENTSMCVPRCVQKHTMNCEAMWAYVNQIHMCIYIHEWKFTWFHMWKFRGSKFTCVFIFTNGNSHDFTCENSQVPNSHVYLYSRMKIHMILHVKIHRFQIHMRIYIHEWKFTRFHMWKFTWFHMWKFRGSKFTCVFIFTNGNSHDFTCENSQVPNTHVYLYSRKNIHMISHVKIHRFQIYMLTFTGVNSCRIFLKMKYHSFSFRHILVPVWEWFTHVDNSHAQTPVLLM